MPLRNRKRARYRYRKIKGGKQRIAFIGSKVVEVCNYIKGKKKCRKL